MSWIDQIRNDYIIRMGDGAEYKPKWVVAKRQKEFNVADFEFPDLDGTLRYRNRPKGIIYSLELFFDGDDHLDMAQAFWDSADDSRVWILIHPYYGSISVQPSGLGQDNTQLNITKFICEVIETITEDAPKMSVNPTDKILSDKVALDNVLTQVFVDTTIPSVTDLNKLVDNNTSLHNVGRKHVTLTENAEEYFNLFNTANAAVENYTADPLQAMRDIQAVINYPSLFQDKVYGRLNCLYEQFDILRLSIPTTLNPSKKRIFQTYMAGVVSAMAVTASTPQDGDYENRDQVYSVIDQVLERYNTLISDLDEMQTENGGELDSFIPDADSLIALNDLMDFTVSNLFAIAIDSKQERTIILQDDTNLILLAHRLYGITPDDSTIVALMDQNKIGISELLVIRKNRKIKYYI